jgi:hypothetical protein
MKALAFHSNKIEVRDCWKKITIVDIRIGSCGTPFL